MAASSGNQGKSTLPDGELTTPDIIAVAADCTTETVRWLKASCGSGFRLVVIPMSTDRPSPDGVIPVSSRLDADRLNASEVGFWVAPDEAGDGADDDLPPPLARSDRRGIRSGSSIAEALARLRPQLLHTNDMAGAGYAGLSAAGILGSAFPVWLASDAGGALATLVKLRAHRSCLSAMMRRVDWIACESQEGAMLCRQLGFTGHTTISPPRWALIHPEEVTSLSSSPSRRKTVLADCRDPIAGGHILSALYLASSSLHGFDVRVFDRAETLSPMIERLSGQIGVRIRVEPVPDSPEAATRLASSCRLVIGARTSGEGFGVHTALAAGAMPLLSDGDIDRLHLESGLQILVAPSHDTGEMARLIAVALGDDEWIDDAAKVNRSHAVRLRQHALGNSLYASLHSAITAPLALQEA